MLKKLMVRTWFGDLPPWTDQFVKHVDHLKQYGWEFLIINNYGWFSERVNRRFGIRLPDRIDKRKCGDWDPYLGAILAEELAKFDYWGHVNLDAVYGRLDRWLPDSFLQNLDIFGNDPGAICGPFSAYKNSTKVNTLFMDCKNWADNLVDPHFRGWDELDFSREVVRQALSGRIVLGSGFFQSHDHIDDAHKVSQVVHIKEDGTLIDGLTGLEIMMYHFNQTRRWPVE